MKPTSALLPSALLALFAVSGCASTEYVEVRPQCTPPSEPATPSIDRGELWDTFIDAERYRETDEPVLIGDARYRALERHVNAAWAWGDEQQALLQILCGKQV